MSVGLLSSESLAGWDNLLPRWFTHTAGKLALAVGRTPYFFPTWTLTQGCLTILMTVVGFPQSERSQSPRRKPECLFII